MRLIPKRTSVKMEFFRNIGLIDMIIIGIGGLLSFSLLLSTIPFHLILFFLVLALTIALVMPIDEEKPYMSIFNFLKYTARLKLFRANTGEEEAADAGTKKGKKKSQVGSVKDITPFTGIDGEFIEYGGKYFACVVEIPSVEFRFFTEEQQDNLIDHVYASVLRTIAMGETGSLVKIDRPLNFDSMVVSEGKKMDSLKEAYLNGLLSDEELTKRIGIIHDRITRIEDFDYRSKIYIPFHYLVFYYKDKVTLTEQVNNMLQIMGANEMECRELKGPELAIFLKYNYMNDFDEREAYTLKPEEYMDWILPKEIKFTARTTVYDDIITHNLRLVKYPTLVTNAWGYRLFNMPGTKVVMKIKPLDHYKSIRQIDRSLQELQEQAEKTGKASKAMELDTHIQTLAEVLRMLQGDNEILFSADCFVTVYDYELSVETAEYKKDPKSHKKPYPKLKKEIKRKLSEESFRTTDMFLQQFEAYASSMISANDACQEDAQNIQGGSIAAAFPYVNKHLSDPGGVYLGDSGGVPVFVNFFRRDKNRVNSNMVIIGKSGSGKSYATKTILTNLAAENSKIFVLDPENEYSTMAKHFDGKIIDVGTAAQGRLNPFHVITSLTDEEGEESEASGMSLNTHLQFLEEFYRQILPGIESDALEYLNNVTSRLYEERGIDNDTDFSKLKPEEYPIFDDLYEKLLNDFQMAQGDYAKKNLRVLLNYISKFAQGGRDANLWDGAASISTNENFIVFNFQSLLANKNGTVANAQMLLVLKWLDNEIIKNRDYNLKYHADRKIIVVIDEAHVFIDAKFPVALDFMFQLAKRIRKYNGMQIVITQNIKDFVGTEELARKSTAIINASQYSFIFALAPNDMTDLVKLYENAGAINESEQSDIVNSGRGQAFLITEPRDRSNVEIIAGPDLERIFSD